MTTCSSLVGLLAAAFKASGIRGAVVDTGPQKWIAVIWDFPSVRGPPYGPQNTIDYNPYYGDTQNNVALVSYKNADTFR